jgi:hypothetical protein
MGAVSILICWKWGDWRNWKLYYPTILYLLIGDLVADFLMFEHSLWGFGEFVEKYPFLDVATMLLFYPTTVILFLTHYPAKPQKQALYILLWVAIYVAAEEIAFYTKGYCYHDGWSIWYSVLFDCVMFPMLALHYKRPLYVWPISAVLCFALLWWFRVPLSR